MPIIIVAVALIIINTIYVKYYKRIRNLKYMVEIKKENIEFNREINVDYSPSIVSYLYNQKIELEKDLISDILNLYARKIVNIRLKEDNTYEIIMDKDKYEDLYWKNELFENDRYILHTLVQKRFDFKYEEWQAKVKKVYRQIVMKSEDKKGTEDEDSEILRVFLKISSVLILAIILLSIILRYRNFKHCGDMRFFRTYITYSHTIN